MKIISVASINSADSSLFYEVGMPLWFNDKDDEIISIKYQDEQAVSYGQTREARQYPVYVVRTKSKRMLVLPAQQFIADYVDTEPEEDN